jgi:Integrase core domain
VHLTATLAACGHLVRCESGHELVTREQLADEDGAVAAIGLDHPERPSASAGKLRDAVHQRLDRSRFVGDPLPQGFLAVGPEHDDPMPIPAGIDPDDQASRHHAHLRAVGLEVPHDTPSRGSHLTHMSDRPQMSIRRPRPTGEGGGTPMPKRTRTDRAIEPSSLVRQSVGHARLMRDGPPRGRRSLALLAHDHATRRSVAHRSATIASGSPATGPSVPLALFRTIWAERFIGTVLSECLCVEVFNSAAERRLGLDRFIGYYNAERPLLGIGGRTPWQRLSELLAA